MFLSRAKLQFSPGCELSAEVSYAALCPLRSIAEYTISSTGVTFGSGAADCAQLFACFAQPWIFPGSGV